MPTIHVQLFEGRTVEQKRRLARAITEATVDVLGGSPASVDIIFSDIARHDWSTGGALWSDQAAAHAAAPAPAQQSEAVPKDDDPKDLAKY